MEKLEFTHILSLFNGKMPLFTSFRLFSGKSLFSLSRPTVFVIIEAMNYITYGQIKYSDGNMGPRQVRSREIARLTI